MKIQDIVAVCSFFVLYTGLLFGGFSWMLKAQLKAHTDPIKAQIELINNKIELTNNKIDLINNKLDNHITDTNKKIDKLSDRFNDLYQFLLEEKKRK